MYMRWAVNLIFALSAIAFAQAPHPGQMIFRLNLTDAKQVANFKAQGAEVVSTPTPCLQVTGSTAHPEGHIIHIPIDIAPLAGTRLVLSGRVMATGVKVTNPGSASGVKFQLTYNTPQGRRWHDYGALPNTFAWRDLGLSFGIEDNATQATLIIGLQNAVGSVCYSDIQLGVLRPSVKRNLAAYSQGHSVQTKTQYRGVMSPENFRAQDFNDLYKWNVNLIRWQVNWPNNQPDWDEAWMTSLLDTLSKVIRAAQANGIKVAIDLHTPPGGRESDTTLRMFVEKKYHDQFIEFWQRIATRFKNNPSLYGYDLINEPVQNDLSPSGTADWLQTETDAAQAIRQIDQTTPIIFATDQWDSPESFRWLTPPPVTNVIYEVHMYSPATFTHQGVHTNQGIAKDANLGSGISYPGIIDGKQIDKEALRQILQPVRDFQLAYNARIYCGEFSAVRWAPGADHWLEDVTSIFEEWGWDYTYHAFREWQGWDLEMTDMPGNSQTGNLSSSPTDRLRVMLKRFSLNNNATR